MQYKRLACTAFALLLLGTSAANTVMVFADDTEGAESVGEIVNIEPEGEAPVADADEGADADEAPADEVTADEATAEVVAAPALRAAPAGNVAAGEAAGEQLRAGEATQNEYSMLLSEGTKTLNLDGVENGRDWRCNVIKSNQPSNGLSCSTANGGSVTASSTGTYTVTYQHREQTGTSWFGPVYDWVDKATVTVNVYDYRLSTTAQDNKILAPNDTFSYRIRSATRGAVKTTVTRDGETIVESTGMNVPAIDTSEEGEYKISIVNTSAKEAGFEMEDNYYFYVVDPTYESAVIEQGQSLTVTGSERWSASVAIDGDAEYVAEDGALVIDTSELSLGMHTFTVNHNFDTGESATVKRLSVIVYKVTSADGEYTEEEYVVAAETLKDLLEQYGAMEGYGDYIKLVTKVGEIFGATDEGFDASNEFGANVLFGNEVVTRAYVDAMDEEDVSDALKAKMESLGAENVTYWNVRVLMEVEMDGDVITLGEMHQLKDTITVAVVEVPSVEDGYTRIYYVVREHDGEIEPLTEGRDFFVKDGVVYIISDKFSAYAVGYTDTLIKTAVASPNTGVATSEGGSATVTNSLAVAVAGVATAIALAGAAIFAKRK